MALKPPPCRNPEHPFGVPRDRAVKVSHQDQYRIAFVCEICASEGMCALQVITRPKGWDQARWLNEQRNLEHAQQRYRYVAKKVTYHHA
jgi:hypothetical protein